MRHWAVDTDGVKAREPTTKGLESIAGRDRKVPEFGGSVHLDELPQSDS